LNRRPLIIPSIDISQGRVASIRQHKTVCFEGRFKDPVEAAVFWAQRGARRIHLIDIDGSGSGHPVNVDVVRAIAGAVSVEIQAGGGVRSPRDAELLKRAGADLVIFRPRPFGREDVEAFRAIRGIILGFDLTDDLPAAKALAWLNSCLSATGARALLICDVAVEGTSRGPRHTILEMLLSNLDASMPNILRDLETIYAGGISTKVDIERLSSIGFSSLVLGTALYRGLIDLSEVS